MHIKEILIGLGSCGIAAGARQVHDTLVQELAENGLKIPITCTGCVGACHREPLMEVRLKDGKSFLYGDLDSKKVKEIVAGHFIGGTPIAENLIPADYSYLARQRKIVLANCGVINPESISDYLEHDGYKALREVIDQKNPQEVIEKIKKSGLRGRGGAGFPTGLKWAFTSAAGSPKKYIICNADEGDPGAFMDRSVLESDPHAVIEGMIIAAYAIGADEGYIYIRAEYPLAIKRLRIAVKETLESNFLGDHILGSDFSFHIHLKEGAGAFVCGEETAGCSNQYQ